MAEEVLTDHLWRIYKRTGDPEVREKLILNSLPTVKMVAERLAFRFPPHLDTEGFISAGIIGLFEAIEKYNPEEKTSFLGYVSLRVRGAILEELRELDFAPRRLRKLEREIREAYAKLEQKLGRFPEEEEVAKYLNLSLEKFRHALQEVNCVALVSLEEDLTEGEEKTQLIHFIEDPTAEDAFKEVELKEMKQLLAKAIEELEQKERLVITLYYYEGLTMKEIGKVIEVTEARVCQIHSKGMIKLKSKLQSRGIDKSYL